MASSRTEIDDTPMKTLGNSGQNAYNTVYVRAQCIYSHFGSYLNKEELTD